MLRKMWSHWNVHIFLKEMGNVKTSLEYDFIGFYKLNIHLHYDPVCWVIYPDSYTQIQVNSTPMSSYRNIYKPVHTYLRQLSFIIIKSWKLPKCLSGECINKSNSKAFLKYLKGVRFKKTHVWFILKITGPIIGSETSRDMDGKRETGYKEEWENLGNYGNTLS